MCVACTNSALSAAVNLLLSGGSSLRATGSFFALAYLLEEGLLDHGVQYSVRPYTSFLMVHT